MSERFKFDGVRSDKRKEIEARQVAEIPAPQTPQTLELPRIIAAYARRRVRRAWLQK